MINIPVLLILLAGIYYGYKWIFRKPKPKPRKYSATVEHLLSLDKDQRINNN